MATPSSKYRLPQAPLDNWSTTEKLALASSVFRSGDQNWASVIRAIKPFTQDDHPSEWFSQKQCALQYAALLDKIDTPKRKRGEKCDMDTPGLRIVRRLTVERTEELKQLVNTQQTEYKTLKTEIDEIRSGKHDDRLPELLAEIEAEEAVTNDTTRSSTLSHTSPAASLPLPDESHAGVAMPELPPSLSISDPVSTVDSSVNRTMIVTAQALDPALRSPLKLHIPSQATIPKGLSTQEHVAKIIKEEAEKLMQEQIVRGLRTPEKSPLRSAKSSPVIVAGASDAKQSPLVISISALSEKLKEHVPIKSEEGEPRQTPSPSLPDASPNSPVKDVHASPDTDVPAPLVKDVHASPGIDVHASPVRDVLTTPENDVHVSPVKDVHVSPVKDEHASPVKDEHASPVKDEHASPVKDVHVSPVKDVHASPAKASTLKQSPPTTSPAPTLSKLLESKPTELIELDDIKQEEGIWESVTSSSQDETLVGDDKQPCDGLTNQVNTEESTANVNTIPPFVHDDDEVSIKEEPYSPSSSVSSRVSEAATVRGHGHHNKDGQNRHESTRKSQMEEIVGTVSRQSEDTTDDESANVIDTLHVGLDAKSLLSLPSAGVDSVPNSPLSQCSDTEDERLYKGWKKSIMLVWRAAATHKYANVFLNKVTNDIAPGYEQIVHRPMDLREIKKNVESGVIRTTSEFQRDVMLMFTNAIMYNDQSHDVYSMATDMYNDMLQYIEQYVSTQLLLLNTEPKALRTSRRSETSDKEDDVKRRRMSVEQTDISSAKRRKTRSDN